MAALPWVCSVGVDGRWLDGDFAVGVPHRNGWDMEGLAGRLGVVVSAVGKGKSQGDEGNVQVHGRHFPFTGDSFVKKALHQCYKK